MLRIVSESTKVLSPFFAVFPLSFLFFSFHFYVVLCISFLFLTRHNPFRESELVCEALSLYFMCLLNLFFCSVVYNV